MIINEKYDEIKTLRARITELKTEIKDLVEQDYQRRLQECRDPEWRKNYVENHWLNKGKNSK